jgi:hypothetical protein
MSDANSVPAHKSAALAEFQKKLEEDKGFDKKRKELQEKKLIVDSYKYDNELTKITQNEEDIKRISSVNVGILDENQIAEIQEENRNYLNNLNDSLVFLDPKLSKLVTAWAGNLILVGAVTNGGKSSLTANLMLKTITQKKPTTGKNRTVLVISNEEDPYAVYNRLTCLVKGWSYSDQDDYTQEQKDILVEFVARWARLGITVIKDDGHGLTTSLEGIQSIFENLFKTKTYYDMVILDYIQKVCNSKRGNLAGWEVMLKTMESLDIYKNTYPAPIVVTSQLKTQSTDPNGNDTDFKERICGRKDILNPVTVGIELIANRESSSSKFVIRKSRFKGEKVGHSYDMGFDKGMFVPHTDEFKDKIKKRNESREYQETVGKHVSEKKEENKG